MTVQYVCQHCGRLTQTPGAVYREVKKTGRTEAVYLCHADDCHPDNPRRFPFDCYRLVTVYGEEIGERKQLGSYLRAAQNDPNMSVKWTEYRSGGIQIDEVSYSSGRVIMREVP